ncbi:MAG: hypothetical protein V7K26_25000 [Nostoc sp.]
MSTTGYDALYETLKANADSLPLRYRRRKCETINLTTGEVIYLPNPQSR